MLKTRYLFSISFLLLSFILHPSKAQDGFTWARKMGGVESDALTAMAKMQDNKIIACGYFASPYSFMGQYNLQNNPGSYYRNFWLALYDPDGNVLWAKSGGGDADEDVTAIAVDEQENIYLTGNFQSYACTVENQTLYKDLNQDYFDTDAFVCSYDRTGTLRWIKGIYDNRSLELSGITIDSQGNLFLSGTFFGDSVYIDQLSVQNTNTGLGDGFVLKMDSQGSPIWLRHIGGDSDDIAAKLTNKNGTIFIAGTSSSSSLSNGLTTIDNPNLNNLIYLTSFDQDGNPGWLEATNMPGYTEVTAIEQDASSNMLVLGDFSGDSLFFAADTLLSDFASCNGMLLRFAADGSPISGFYFGGANDDFASALSVDVSGNFHITGSFKSTSLRLGSFTLNRSGNDQNMGDAYYACFSSDGQCLSALKIGGSKHESGSAIVTNTQSDFWIGGQFNSSSLFIGDWLLESNSADNSDGFMARYTPLNSNKKLSMFEQSGKVFPNPTSGGDVNIRIPESNNPCKVELLDMQGKLLQVIENQSDTKTSNSIHTLNLPSAGVYLIRCSSLVGVWTEKVVRLK